MEWQEILKALAKMRIPHSLTFDVDYGIDKKTGWTFTMYGCIRAQFSPTPEHAVISGLVAQAFCCSR